MAKYRKRPVVVEAEQWLPGKDIPGVSVESAEEIAASYTPNAAPRYYVVTIHGQRAYLAPGDWIIAEPDGQHFYPCKPDVFAATYQPVPGPTKESFLPVIEQTLEKLRHKPETQADRDKCVESKDEPRPRTLSGIISALCRGKLPLLAAACLALAGCGPRTLPNGHTAHHLPHYDCRIGHTFLSGDRWYRVAKVADRPAWTDRGGPHVFATDPVDWYEVECVEVQP